MNIIKKLIFAPIFLIAFAVLIYQFTLLLKSYDFIFSLSTTTLIQFIVIAVAVSISSFLFVLFATIASDWKISVTVGAVASIIPMIFMEKSLGLVFSVGILVSVLLISLTLEGTLKSYLNFQPFSLLGPPIRHLSGLIILSFCLIFFLSINKTISQNGFQIPDSLIETALKFASPASLNSPNPPQPSIPPEQLEFLKENPDLLRQAGLDPGILDTLNQSQPKAGLSQNLTQDLIKQTVKDQIQNFIKPYQNFIPAVLAILLFLTLQSLVSMINLLIYPLLWLTFLILEKTGFIKFEIEQRPVKKMVV